MAGRGIHQNTPINHKLVEFGVGYGTRSGSFPLLNHSNQACAKPALIPPNSRNLSSIAPFPTPSATILAEPLSDQEFAEFLVSLEDVLLRPISEKGRNQRRFVMVRGA